VDEPGSYLQVSGIYPNLIFLIYASFRWVFVISVARQKFVFFVLNLRMERNSAKIGPDLVMKPKESQEKQRKRGKS